MSYDDFHSPHVHIYMKIARRRVKLRMSGTTIFCMYINVTIGNCYNSKYFIQNNITNYIFVWTKDGVDNLLEMCTFGRWLPPMFHPKCFISEWNTPNARYPTIPPWSRSLACTEIEGTPALKGVRMCWHHPLKIVNETCYFEKCCNWEREWFLGDKAL